MRTLRPMTRRAAGVATLLSATLTLLVGLGGAADANPSTGMIDGSYAAQMPAYSLQTTLRPGVKRVCVQIRSQDPMVLLGTVKTQDHGGTWTDTGRLVTLVPDSGATVPPLKPASEYETDDDWNTALTAWNNHYRNEDGSVNPRGGRGVRLRFVGHALTDLFPDIRTAPVGAGLYRSLYRSMSISAHRNTESRHHGSGWVWRQGSQETQADGSSR